MTHPNLGLPPPDPTAGHPEAAARLRLASGRLAAVALESTLQHDPSFQARHDGRELQRFLRDYGRHVEQLARALETGQARFVVQYAEWLVPVYRHRGVSMRDAMALLDGMAIAASSVLSADDGALVLALVTQWEARLRHHQRLAGDHAGNSLLRFFWKGAGIADDSAV
jgi:hypothetical protein